MERMAVSERLGNVFEELRAAQETIKFCIMEISKLLGEYEATDTVAEIKRAKLTVLTGKPVQGKAISE